MIRACFSDGEMHPEEKALIENFAGSLGTKRMDLIEEWLGERQLDHYLAGCLVADCFDGRSASEGGNKIVAHRGASYDAPENTLAAFRLAFKQGADAIEGDFRLTSDGHIVAFMTRMVALSEVSLPLHILS